MNCCQNCFTDREIKAIISELSINKGDCDVCGSEESTLVNIEDLTDFFSPILDLYVPDDTSNTSIHEILKIEWNIFRNIDCSETILNEMFAGSAYQELFNHNVRPEYTGSAKSIEIWGSFTDEIKTKNRFFITNNVFVLEVIEKLLKYHTFDLKAGTLLYRSRICESPIGLPAIELGAPNSGKARPGRANPSGISYLYLAKSEETTLYEVRASFLDYVSVGKFELLEDLKVVSLSDIHNISPFSPDLDLKEYVSNKNILQQFSTALSKPLRRKDSDLEYLPSQYLCEFIKSLGIDGVEYISAMHEGGVNYAFFDQTKFKLIDSTTKEVKKVLIETELADW